MEALTLSIQKDANSQVMIRGGVNQGHFLMLPQKASSTQVLVSPFFKFCVKENTKVVLVNLWGTCQDGRGKVVPTKHVQQEFQFIVEILLNKQCEDEARK